MIPVEADFLGILDDVQKRITDAVSGAFNSVVDFFYIAEWGTIVFVVVAICVLLALFFTHPVIRATLGFIAGGAIAFFAGMVLMFKRDREKKVPPPKPKPIPPKQDPGDWWRFP
jgi:Na+/H+-translocating membrane pyrophosphatase